MLKELIKKEMENYGLKLSKPNRNVYKYILNKTKSRERALIPGNRYSNLYHIQKYEHNTLRYIMSSNFLKKLPDIDKAADILHKHITNNSLIYQVIDYDVDGIASGAVSFLIFKHILKYKRYKVIINNRSWRNGINDTIVNQILDINKNRKIGLMITSDHGSSDGNRLKTIKDNDIDVIVTDHHVPSEVNSPEEIVDAFVNHKRSNSLFTNDITGTAVIYFTLFYYALKYMKVNKDLIDEFYKLMPYVGLTTISDSVDMSDWVNRKLVKYTLNVLNSNRKLDYFWEVVKDKITSSWFIDQEFISFNLIARLNSPGRISDPSISFKLMIADTYSKAEELLEEITSINEERKNIQNEAMKNLDKEYVSKDLTVAYKKNISGIQGIIASKLLYKNRSSMSFCFTEEHSETISGSARSINKSISLIDVLNQLKHKDYIKRFGGHAAACGVEIEKNSLEQFFNDINKILENKKLDMVTYTVDDIITNEQQLYKTFMANVAELPFGQNYSQPLYVSKFKLTNSRIIERNGNLFLVGNVKLITDEGLSSEEYKILYTIETEEEKEILRGRDFENLLIVYNIGLNKFKENRINITAEKIYYLH